MPAIASLSADRIGGLIWIVFGGAILYGSWAMDRLDSLNIPPATTPGVVPGLLGIGLMIFGAVLLLRRPAAPGVVPGPTFDAPAETEAVPEAPVHKSGEVHWRRVFLSGGLCLVYGGLLLGRGVPYWVLTAAFLFLHVALLDETESVPARLTVRRLILAAIIAVTVATIVALLFRYVFLVRLP